EILARHFGASHAGGLLLRALGIDYTPVEPPGDPKSVSRETTLAEDLHDLDRLKSMLKNLADHVAWTLRCDGFMARCVSLKLRLLPVQHTRVPQGGPFGTLLTRRHTLPAATDSVQSIYEIATHLLDEAAASTGLGRGVERVRLLGVGTSSLVRVTDLRRQGFVLPAPDLGVVPAASQHENKPPRCEERGEERDSKLSASLDSIRERYGFGSISLGSGRGEKQNHV
ncbi:MAG: hypothetical protein M3014_03740, partial [Chloroflexota bacterium]|nr:hypothetical protein [Chloroflexota bacterium]